MMDSSDIQYFIRRISERLWVKPLAVCLVSILAAFGAKLADTSEELAHAVPAVTEKSVETLLSIMSASMLVIATFAVASMVSAYASASRSATPRSFRLVLADDVSQNALSTFIGAFIFSIVALTALENGYFGIAGRFTLFVLTALVFALVVLTFVRWVDRIARLGRLGATVQSVEQATAAALKRRRAAPALSGRSVARLVPHGRPLFANEVGYVQSIDVSELQCWAEKTQGRVTIAALPGTFAVPGRALAYVSLGSEEQAEDDCKEVIEAFRIGHDRLFDDDPRFGLVVLSEIAGRALSPAVNDPGTAIEVIGTLVRLFVLWHNRSDDGGDPPKYDRVEAPEITVEDMFDDAFISLARDGAGSIEVAVRLQKAFRTLADLDDDAMRDAAARHARLALARAEIALDLPEDLAAVRDAAPRAAADLYPR